MEPKGGRSRSEDSIDLRKGGQAMFLVSEIEGEEEEGPTHLLKMHNVICKSGELERRVESSA